MREQMTGAQQKVLAFLQKESRAGALPPTVRDICRGAGVKSTSSVHGALKFLAENGYISRREHTSRAVALSGTEPSVQVPVMGTVTAGAPILAIEQIEGYVPFSAASARGRELFALKVKGDSMINAGIIDGDLVIAERCETAENRRIVVALIGEEATVKRLVRENGVIFLAPENPAYENIYADDLTVLGRVVASLRSYE